MIIPKFSKLRMMPLHLHVNQKSDNDDDDEADLSYEKDDQSCKFCIIEFIKLVA